MLPPAREGGKRLFAAIALLWRRGNAQPGDQVEFVGAWLFGTCTLSNPPIRAFCTQRGNLQQIQPDQIRHPPQHNPEADTIVIPNAHLVQGVVDENGVLIPRNPNHNGLTIDLEEVRCIIDEQLPDPCV